jgi:hypothetical protein
MQRTAILSDCGTYRYELRRQWSEAPAIGWIMLNPSTADADVDDPTIRRCISFAQRWGYGGIVVRNLFALRATDPRELAKHPAPIGPANTHHLYHAVSDALTVCAWGNGGRPLAGTAAQYLAEAGVTLHHLGLTKVGQPKHPLYLKASTQPILWSRPVGDTEGGAT